MISTLLYCKMPRLCLYKVIYLKKLYVVLRTLLGLCFVGLSVLKKNRMNCCFVFFIFKFLSKCTVKLYWPVFLYWRAYENEIAATRFQFCFLKGLDGKLLIEVPVLTAVFVNGPEPRDRKSVV